MSVFKAVEERHVKLSTGPTLTEKWKNSSQNVKPATPFSLPNRKSLLFAIKSHSIPGKRLAAISASTNSDFHLALLDWWNTPTESMKSSLAQRMFGRRTRTLLSTSKKLLKSQLVTDVRGRKLQKKQVQTHYYYQNVKEKGDVVRMNGWSKAQVEQQVNVRSYAVWTEGGRFFRRNPETSSTVRRT